MQKEERPDPRNQHGHQETTGDKTRTRSGSAMAMATLTEPDLRVPRCPDLNQSWLLQKPQSTGVSSAARTLAVRLQQMRWAMKALLTYLHPL
jgi:hypothetical protein